MERAQGGGQQRMFPALLIGTMNLSCNNVSAEK
jgi:hypothetical protein